MPPYIWLLGARTSGHIVSIQHMAHTVSRAGPGGAAGRAAEIKKKSEIFFVEKMEGPSMAGMHRAA
jgi:hypothetical protein